MTLLTWDFNFHVTNSIVEGLTSFPCGVSLFKNVNIISQCEGALNTVHRTLVGGRPGGTEGGGAEAGAGTRTGDPSKRWVSSCPPSQQQGRGTWQSSGEEEGFLAFDCHSQPPNLHGCHPAHHFSFPLTGASVWIKNRAIPCSVPVSRCCSVFGGHLPALRGCGSHVMMIHC